MTATMRRSCTLPGCVDASIARGLCRFHYDSQRSRSGGRPRIHSTEHVLDLLTITGGWWSVSAIVTRFGPRYKWNTVQCACADLEASGELVCRVSSDGRHWFKEYRVR